MNNNSLSEKTFSGMIWKFAERILAQLVSTVVAIVLARLLMPEDYAVVSIVTIFFTFCNLFISCGLNSALIQKKDSDILDYSTILFASLIFAAVLYLVMFFASPYIAGLYDQPILVPVIRVMGVSFFINAVKSVVCAKISNDLRFKMFFAATLVGTILSAIIGIWMALKGFGAWALIAQQISNISIDTIILLAVSRIRFVFKFSFSRFKKLFSFGFNLFLAGIISTFYDEIRPLIVGIRFSPTDLAFYNKGMQYPKMIYSAVNDTFASVLFPVMSKVQDDLNAISGMTRKFIRVSSFVVFPFMLGLFAVSNNLIILLLTEKWSPIIIYVKIFSVISLFTIIQKGNLLPIRSIGRSDLILVLDIIKKIIYLVILVLFVIFSKKPEVLAVMGILTNLIAFFINSYATQKMINYRIVQQMMDIIENLIPATIMCVIVSLLGRLPLVPIILLCIQIITGMMIYCALGILFKNSSFFYLLGFLKTYCKRIKERSSFESQ